MKGIQIENMKKVLKSFTLGPLKLGMDAGYVVAVIGKNGCGKSTFFNCLLGVESFDGECIWLEEEKISPEGSGNICGISRRFAYILERCPFPKEYTPRELARCYGGFYEEFDEEKYYAMLKRYNIPVNKALVKLSRGNVIVVQMAFAFAYRSEVLFLDEPSSHLDSYAREELYRLISDYEAEGHMIFWASHQMEELDKMADYVLGIKKGEQFFFTSKEELTERYHVVKGSKRQLDYMKRALVGRRDEESFSVGLVDTQKEYLRLAAAEEPAGLGDIVEFLL